MKPLIGITCSMGLGIYSMTQENVPQLQHRLGDNYVKAVMEADGIPVLLPNSTAPSSRYRVISFFRKMGPLR